ncbi:MAG: hypothetical protein GX968_04335 [Tissierellia bacterium]|nr:hypothetical protein [Tissierellia bacterium]
MDYLYQKVAYLKGLAEGLGIEEESKEGKLLLHIIDTLEDFADVISEIAEEQEELEEYVNYIDEDLTDVEEDLYGLDDEDFYPFEDFDEEDFDHIDFDIICCNDEEDFDIDE